MDRLFLDANVLFSAAYRANSGLVALWDLSDVRLLSSFYAIAEADRNLGSPERRQRLQELVRECEIVADRGVREAPEEEMLPEKDRPILRAALSGRATHLITGDVTHFGQLFGSQVAGVLVLRPGEYLRSRQPSR